MNLRKLLLVALFAFAFVSVSYADDAAAESDDAAATPEGDDAATTTDETTTETTDETEATEDEAPKEPEVVDGFTTEERDYLQSHGETHEFQAEVTRLMDIIINSLYTQKEVFLRELVSNASDALDKIRFLSLTEKDVLGDNTELLISVEADKEAKTLSITDTGIGMTREDLIQHLGTIAKSGTTKFIEAISKGGDMNLIGQFGVGFYSSFLVADKVTVTTKNNDDVQLVWTSQAGASFTISEDPRGPTLKRGTRVTLHLKEDSYELLEDAKLKELIKKYSQFMNFPIQLLVTKTISEEVEVDEEEEEETADKEEKSEDDLDIEEEDDEEDGDKEKKKKTKTVKRDVHEWETINDEKAIWLRPKDEIEESEYNDFFKSITKETSDPLTYSHFSAEGEIEFRSILFVPGSAPSDMFDNYYAKSSAIKLFVRRVLIADEFEEFLPRYLSFVRGVVDSDDLPLNVSREQLQQSKILKVISKKLVKKTIDMIKKLAEEEEEEDEEDSYDDEETENEKEETETEDEEEKTGDEEEEEEETKSDKYSKFWKSFAKNIKLGVIEDSTNRSKLAKLLRFYSSSDKEQLISLEAYVKRMPESQKKIFYLAGESKDAIFKSPHLQSALKKEVEVLLLDDPLDEYCMQHLNEFDGKSLQDISKGDFSLGNETDLEKKKEKKLKEMYEPLTKWFKDTLSNQINTVKISKRLTDDPCVLTATDWAQSANMERINRAQAFGGNQGQQLVVGAAQKDLEINAGHPTIKELLKRVNDETVDDNTKALAQVLFDAAVINSGYSVEDPTQFVSRVEALVKSGLGVSADAAVEEPEVDLTEDEEEEEENKGDSEDDEVNLDDSSDDESEDAESTEEEEAEPEAEADATESDDEEKQDL
eukprot:CAMPEP_0115016678 /NCGR_PEP_ID=MMETSP0216-20121206/27602_1 /TAXON_ID=223996 /ORGANISM="Protocruzia adherens, Strain Boccale" /LENGTH=878 /DNA_ID=CAMNT_0002387225 /DNA_START=114 /DNA_END=2750 /DNA_ORIENTATION=+